jgi:hypothetical protein
MFPPTLVSLGLFAHADEGNISPALALAGQTIIFVVMVVLHRRRRAVAVWLRRQGKRIRYRPRKHPDCSPPAGTPLVVPMKEPRGFWSALVTAGVTVGYMALTAGAYIALTELHWPVVLIGPIALIILFLVSFIVVIVLQRVERSRS